MASGSPDGEIWVALRLATDKMKSDMQAAMRAVREQMGGASGTAKVTTDTDKAASATDKLTASTRRHTQAIKDQIAEWRKLNAGGIAPGQKIRDASGGSSGGVSGPGRVIPMGAGGLATGIPMLGSSGRPPIIPPPVIAAMGGGSTAGSTGGASQATWGRMIRGITMGAGLGFGGMSSGIGALASGGAGAAIAGITIAVNVIRKALNEVAGAIKSAASDYARALMQHKPMGWAVQEGSLAAIMGVSAESVRQFGKQIAWLSSETKQSISTLTQSINPLTAIEWHWKSLMLNMRASFSQFAAALGPAINKMMEQVMILMDLFQQLGVFSAIGDYIANILQGMVLATMAAATALTALQEAIKDFAQTVLHYASNGIIPKGNDANAFKDTRAMWAKLLDMIKTPAKNLVPPPMASADRLPSSAWEKMGLVIGQASTSNPALQTARNTAKMVSLLQGIASRDSGFRGGSMTYNRP